MTATHLLTSVVEFLVALGLKERSALFLVVQSLGWYEPTNIIFLTIAACTIYSNVTHFVVIFSPTNSKGGWNGRFCFTGPMIWWALEAKPCPERPQAIKKAKNGQSFPLENNYFPFFLNEMKLQVLEGVPDCETFRANIRIRIWPAYVKC